MAQGLNTDLPNGKLINLPRSTNRCMVLFLWASLSLLSCGDIQSSNYNLSSTVDFSSIVATYEVVQFSGQPTTVYTYLIIQGGDPLNYVKFDEGETFSINGNSLDFTCGNPDAAVGLCILGSYYGATVEMAPSVSSVEIVFKDKTGQAHSQTLQLPTSVAVTLPTSGTVVDPSTEFQITYEPAVPAYCILDFASPTTKIYSANPAGTCSINNIPQDSQTDGQLDFVIESVTDSNTPPAGFTSGKLTSIFRTDTLTLRTHS